MPTYCALQPIPSPSTLAAQNASAVTCSRWRIRGEMLGLDMRDVSVSPVAAGPVSLK